MPRQSDRYRRGDLVAWVLAAVCVSDIPTTILTTYEFLRYPEINNLLGMVMFPLLGLTFLILAIKITEVESTWRDSLPGW